MVMVFIGRWMRQDVEEHGLRDSRAIGKVIVNPTNPDIAFVAALGHPYGPNTERGIFRTTDGGKTWEKFLQGRKYRRHRCGVRSAQSEYPFCRAVAGAAHFVEYGPVEGRERAVSLE